SSRSCRAASGPPSPSQRRAGPARRAMADEGTRCPVPGAQCPAEDPTPGTRHPAPILEGRGLTRRFGGVTALKGVDVAIRPGEILAVIGPNGAGKTTLFNLVGGVLPPDEGDVYLDGRRVTGESPHRIAARGVARTF